MENAIQIARLILILALIIVAAALSTPKGRLPLALRGVMRILRRDRGLPAGGPVEDAVPVGKRILAFFLVVAAFAFAFL